MDKTQDHLEQLAEIRLLMDRSSRFISLSGLSGVVAGIAALAGAYAAYLYFGQNIYYPEYYKKIFTPEGTVYVSFIKFLLIDALAVIAVSTFFGVLLTIKRAGKQGHSLLDKTALKLFINISIPLVAGGIYVLLLLHHRDVYLIAPTTLIFYGLALVNASKYTLDDIRYLGISEIVLGLLATFFSGYGLVFWALGFGVLHIFYGLMMYFKYER